MTTDTVLTKEQRESFKAQFVANGTRPHLTVAELSISLQTEQAVLQSPEVQRLREDAGRYRWLKANIMKDYELPGSYYIPDEDTGTWDRTIDAAMREQP